MEMHRGPAAGVLAWHRLSLSPRAPASFCADPDQVALGLALAARVIEATRLTAEDMLSAGLGELATDRFAKPIHDVHALTTRAIARFLVTGQGTTESERNFVARLGFLCARNGLSLTTLTRSYLVWRDTNLRVLNDEISRLSIAAAVSDLARMMVRSSADTGILRMTRAYDAIDLPARVDPRADRLTRPAARGTGPARSPRSIRPAA
jgi:hypothetical protein